MTTYSYSTTTSNDVIKYTVATAGTYDITGYGGQGGKSGGKGAEVSGNFVLQAGEKLEIIVGGAGLSASGGSGGGGGASSVFADVNAQGVLTPGAYSKLLLVAGGGGGSSFSSTGSSASGSATTGAAGGAGGQAGSNAGGGGGAGAKADGSSAANHGSYVGGKGGKDTADGSAGGTAVSKGGLGGFGGGGSGAYYGGGGGGGYTGGNGGSASASGIGGTSFDAGTANAAQTVSGQNAGAGKVTIAAVCYCTETLIRTARGDVAVEHLAIGDLVVTASGAHRPIRWLGHRDTDCARHSQPRKVWPVRVAAGALGAGLPYADLWLSPGHALCLDDVLIPVRCLVQGEAVMQVERDSVTYWHVELDSHDILIANGVPAESYLDTGNRCAFDNAPGPVDLHPDFEAHSADGFCRPVVESGPLLSAARFKLFGAAPAAPAPAPAQVYMMANGIVLQGMVDDSSAVFMVPAGTRDLRLVSPSFPAQAPDVRTLGVVVGSLAIEAASQASRTVAMDDSGLFAGFHEIETSEAGFWRWTDGDAHLAPSLWAGIDGAFILRIVGIFPAVRNDAPARIAA